MRIDMYVQSSKTQPIKECMVHSEGLRGKKAHGQDKTKLTSFEYYNTKLSNTMV